jgi:5-methylcytosine-specific restriction endonuclease McrA
MPYKDPAKQKEYQRKWMLQRRRDFQKGRCCVQCGSTRQLEVDHIDPSTKVTHRVWAWSKKKREAELAKCQVLCKKCHATKSGNERRKEMVHGTRGAYRKGCKCDLCRAVQREYMQRYRLGERPGSIVAT